MMYYYSTPLVHIFSDAKAGKWETVFYYLRTQQLNINARDPDGLTLLDYAIVQYGSSRLNGKYKRSIINFLRNEGAKTGEALENPSLHSPPKCTIDLSIKRDKEERRDKKALPPSNTNLTHPDKKAGAKGAFSPLSITPCSAAIQVSDKGKEIAIVQEIGAQGISENADTAEEESLLNFAELEKSLLTSLLEPVASPHGSVLLLNTTAQPTPLPPGLNPLLQSRQQPSALTYSYPLASRPEDPKSSHADRSSLRPFTTKPRMDPPKTK